MKRPENHVIYLSWPYLYSSILLFLELIIMPRGVAARGKYGTADCVCVCVSVPAVTARQLQMR